MRKATREEKKRKAMAMREKELGALGMQVRALAEDETGLDLAWKIFPEL